MFVYRTLARYRETGSTKDQPRSGRPHDIRTQKRIHTAREHIWRNLLRKPKVMSRDMEICSRTMSRVLQGDLCLGVYKRAQVIY